MAPDNLANLLGATAVMVYDDVVSAIGTPTLNPSHQAALQLLSKYPGCSIQDLSGPLALTHSGTVRLVDKLVAQGLVERRPKAQDRRVATLFLTPGGGVACGEGRDRRHHALRSALGALDDRERSQLGALLGKLLAHGRSHPEPIVRTCRLCDYEACEICPFDVREPVQDANA